MPDPEKTTIEPIASLPVTLIGVRTEGTGAPIEDGQVIVTPPGQPNLVARVIGPTVAILVRFANAYLTALVGLLMAAGVSSGAAVGAADFYHSLLSCSTLALAGPVVAFLKDLITIFGNLEKKYPLLTGSV